MRFTDPLYLGLIPIFIGLIWFFGRRQLGMSAGRRRFVLAIRSLIALLLIFGLAGFQSVRQNKGVCVIYLLDLSDSLSESGKKAGEAYIRQSLNFLTPDDMAGLVVFGQDAYIDSAPMFTKSFGPIYSAPNRRATDIASAIRLASALFPDGLAKRIVLLSDGNETQGLAVQTAQAVGMDNVEIDVVALASAEKKDEVLISDVTAPSETKIGEPFNLKVVIESTSTASGILRIDRDGEPIRILEVNLMPGKNVITTSIQTDSAGFHRYRAFIDAKPDADIRNNEGRTFVAVKGKPKVLYAGKSSSSPLISAMPAHDIDIEVIKPGGLPASAHEFQSYDAIIFDDYPAMNVSGAQMLAIESAVRDSGIGFVMIGGENSFLPGGYYDTPIAKLLPVDLNVRNKKTYPPATVIIVVDISGSMGAVENGVQKVQVAAQGAISVLSMLRDDDMFGVIVSGTGSDWLAQLQPANNKNKVIEQIQKIQAGGGGIYCRPSIEFAKTALLTQNTRVKHMIILADGSDCDEQEGCIELANAMAANGATITTIALGDGKDVPFLQLLATAGKGQFYLCRSASELPRVFTSDVSIMTRSAIQDGAFIPQVDTSDEMLKGIDWQAAPPLLAYDVTSDRPIAKVVMRSPSNDPVLAYWQYELGTSIAFTSDAQAKWASKWVNWQSFGPLWAQIIRNSLRRSGMMNYTVTTRREGGSAIVNMQAYTPEGDPINFLQPELSIAEPDGRGQKLVLQQLGPGEYQGAFPIGDIGDYVLTVTEPGKDGEKRVFNTGFSIPYPIEYRFSQANTAVLNKIAESTGGKMAPIPTDIFRESSRPGKSIAELWQILLWIALGLFMLDVTVRRVVIPIHQITEFFVNAWNKFKLANKKQAEAPEQATAELLKVKSRASSKTSRNENPLTLNSEENTSQPTQPQEPKPEATKPSAGTSQSLQSTERLLNLKKHKDKPTQNGDDE